MLVKSVIERLRITEHDSVWAMISLFQYFPNVFVNFTYEGHILLLNERDGLFYP